MTAAEATRAAAAECADRGHLYATDVTGRGCCVVCGASTSKNSAPSVSASISGAPHE